MDPIDSTSPFLVPANQPPAKADARDVDIGTRNELICTVTLVLRLDDPTTPESIVTFNAGAWSPIKKGATHIYVLSTDETSPTRTFRLAFQKADG